MTSQATIEPMRAAPPGIRGTRPSPLRRVTGEPDGPLGQTAGLATVERTLDDIERRPAMLLLEGEVGAGKTTLWRAAVRAARARGHRVLACHPAESEASMAFAGLGDLLEGVLDDAGGELPDPQLRALKVAVLLEDPDGPAPDQRSVSVATLALVRNLAALSPVVIAVDDYHWMDPATARVLRFVLRRLESERVGFIAALRPHEGQEVPELVDRHFMERGRRRLVPAPLAADDLDTLFRLELDSSFARPVLRQIAAASGGNPLFALEIARGIQGGELEPQPGLQLPIPGTLQQLVRDRLAGLPGGVQELLVLAAAVSEPTVDVLGRAALRPDASGALAAAVRAGIVRLDGERVRFSHPLFASTLYHSVDVDRRRTLHARLATLVTGPHERARHLSLAANGPDGTVAAALDSAALAAASRGAPDAAADLAEQARRLTPDGDEEAAHRRLVQAAEYHFAAGDMGRARSLLEAMTATLPAGPTRADILRRLAKVRYRNDSCSVAAELLTRALMEAGDDPSLHAGIERDLAWAVTLCGDVRDAARHAAAALRVIEETADPALLPELLAAGGLTSFLLGEGLPSETMRRSVELDRGGSEVPIEWRPRMILATMLKWAGELQDARRHFEELHRQTVEAGDETSLPYLLSQMSETETWLGEWAGALRLAEDGHAMALQTGQEPIRATALYARSLVEAHLGLVDEARASARAGLELSERVGSVVSMMLNQSVLGFLDLSLDEPSAAHDRLGPLVAWLDVVGIHEPGVLRFVPDEVEALIALGQPARADLLLCTYERDARRLGRPWAMLAAARVRAMHTAAAGNAPAASSLLERRLGEDGPRAQPFERARALLVLGTIQRRTRRRKAARASLEAALEIFDRLGAKLWSRKASRMLGGDEGLQVTPTARLTPAERRVADLVASGATNRAAADRLFVSVRAVEVHLTSIYRKLGISSRTELAALMARDDVIPPGAPAASEGASE